MTTERQEVLQRACDYLGRREHSRKELKNKLYRGCDDEVLIEDLLETLALEGLQSDERFTESFVCYRQARGQGPLKIKQELYQRGIDDDLINTYLFTNDCDWFETIKAVRQKRFGSELPGDIKSKAKQSRFLYSRGFDSELIKYALNKVDE